MSYENLSHFSHSSGRPSLKNYEFVIESINSEDSEPELKVNKTIDKRGLNRSMFSDEGCTDEEENDDDALRPSLLPTPLRVSIVRKKDFVSGEELQFPLGDVKKWIDSKGRMSFRFMVRPLTFQQKCVDLEFYLAKIQGGDGGNSSVGDPSSFVGTSSSAGTSFSAGSSSSPGTPAGTSSSSASSGISSAGTSSAGSYGGENRKGRLVLMGNASFMGKYEEGRGFDSHGRIARNLPLDHDYCAVAGIDMDFEGWSILPPDHPVVVEEIVESTASAFSAYPKTSVSMPVVENTATFVSAKLQRTDVKPANADVKPENADVKPGNAVDCHGPKRDLDPQSQASPLNLGNVRSDRVGYNSLPKKENRLPKESEEQAQQQQEEKQPYQKPPNREDDPISNDVDLGWKAERMEHSLSTFKDFLNATWDTDHSKAAQLMASPVTTGGPRLKEILFGDYFESIYRKRKNSESQSGGKKKRKSQS